MTLISMCCMRLHAWAATACVQYADQIRDWRECKASFDFLQKQTISLYSKAHRMVLGLTQTPTQSVLLFCLRGVQRYKFKADHSHPSSVAVENDWSINSTPLNPLTPNDHYISRTAPLTSKRCILYIYSTNIGIEYFKHGI